MEIKTKQTEIISYKIPMNPDSLNETKGFAKRFPKVKDRVLSILKHDDYARRNYLWLCYDNKTEIMTEDGWKLFRNLKNEEKVATLNNKGDIEYNKISKIIKKKYNGNVYCVNVKNNIIYVRRNMKPMWCGNCMLYWAKCGQIKIVVPLEKFNQVNSPETITRAFRKIMEEHEKEGKYNFLKENAIDEFRKDREHEVREYFRKNKNKGLDDERL